MSDILQRKVQNKNDRSRCSDREDLRYGPMPSFPNQKRFTRIIIAISIGVILYFYTNDNKERFFASSKNTFSKRMMAFPCSENYSAEVTKYPGCVPKKCGRAVLDKLISTEEAAALRKLAEGGLSVGSASGGARILDLHSGALSHGEAFINIYETHNAQDIFTEADLRLYSEIRLRIQNALVENFNLENNKLYLTHPTFFSQLTAAEPRTIHDEYWHAHVDKETYGSFHYTGLVYLSSYSQDFKGGRFHFIESDNTSTVIEPTLGRVSIFTSGWENLHRVERVTDGVRLALTVAFTCDPRFGVDDPHYARRVGDH